MHAHVNTTIDCQGTKTTGKAASHALRRGWPSGEVAGIFRNVCLFFSQIVNFLCMTSANRCLL